MFYLRHSEIHAMYQTAIVCFIGLVIMTVRQSHYMAYYDLWKWILLTSIFFVTIIGGVVLDAKLCAEETCYCKTKEQEIRVKLKESKFPPQNNTKGPSKKNIKRIIAREGLISLCLLTVGSIYFLYNFFSGKSSLFMTTPLELWRNHLLLIGVPFYIIYLPIRFIIWALRTLREGK
jgi:hypothetical protein